MKIIVILRNIYHNPDLFDDEQYLCKSDRNILAEAMMLKEKCGGVITALLFAESVHDSTQTLKKACTYGVDYVYHITFHDFDFSDTNTFSRVIAKTVQRYFSDFDLILFGRLAYDGDAVNIATQTAYRLEIPEIVYSREMTPKKNRQSNFKQEFWSIVVRRMISDYEDMIYRIELPALVQSIRETGVTRQPKIADIIRTYSEVEIKKIDGDAIAWEVGKNVDTIVLYKKKRARGLSIEGDEIVKWNE